jgi:hypothetical protein
MGVRKFRSVEFRSWDEALESRVKGVSRGGLEPSAG